MSKCKLIVMGQREMWMLNLYNGYVHFLFEMTCYIIDLWHTTDTQMCNKASKVKISQTIVNN